ncbi:hypothetical protein DEO72_LG6g310 [Vigna unguiculata]|uniref:Uncharacterized protein n=1 Tax=Vigna unguiculata TaxID=3917 RepID=A0A4D6M620_VIGUN|nr:hypothetical protein DEO72_LG6g310 [Vigna unguiculata]
MIPAPPERFPNLFFFQHDLNWCTQRTAPRLQGLFGLAVWFCEAPTGGVSGVGVSGDNGYEGAWGGERMAQVRVVSEVFSGGAVVVRCSAVDVVEVFEVVGGGGWWRSCHCGGEGGRPDVRPLSLFEGGGAGSCELQCDTAVQCWPEVRRRCGELEFASPVVVIQCWPSRS